METKSALCAPRTTQHCVEICYRVSVNVRSHARATANKSHTDNDKYIIIKTQPTLGVLYAVPWFWCTYYQPT